MNGPALCLMFALFTGCAGDPSAPPDPPNGGPPPNGSGGPLLGQIIVDPNNSAWLVYNRDSDANGMLDPFFLVGPGDPEGLLYEGQRNPDGTRTGGRQDVIINRIISEGGNSVYLHAVRSNGGDGDDSQNPFVDSNPALGLDDDILDQWQAWFTRLDNAGVTIFLFLYDDHAKIWDTGDAISADERQFVTGLVQRFDGLKHLIWCVAEEYRFVNSEARISNLAAVIREADRHDHPIAVHHMNGNLTMDFPSDPNIDIFGMQIGPDSPRQMHDRVLTGVVDGAGRFNLTMAEAFPYHGQLLQQLARGELRRSIWAAAMAGGYVMVYGTWAPGGGGSGIPGNDPTPEMLGDMRRVQRFFEATDFNTMIPRDDLEREGTRWVLADPGRAYIAYASGGDEPLGLADLPTGTYDLRWFNPITGEQVEVTGVMLDGDVSFPRPQSIGGEAALYVRRE